MGKKSPAAPAPPDYIGAAKAQGGANVDTAIAESVMNRPTIVTPYGTQSWTQSGSYTTPGGYTVPQWTGTQNLTPLGQKTFDTEQRIYDQLAATGEAGLGRVKDTFAQPYDYSGVGDLQNKTEAAYMARLDPMLTRSRNELDQRLANQGITLGSEAYSNAMLDQGKAETDARQQAILAANAMRPQALQESYAMRNQPLNELNALISSSQVNVPQFQNAPASSFAPAPLYQATAQQYGDQLNMYNAQLANQSNFLGGLMGLGGALGGAAIGRKWG